MTKERGFSLIELLIVIVVLIVMTGGIFRLIRTAMVRQSTEQARLDMFQEAREFMDQMSRDLRQAGYPSGRNIAVNVPNATPAYHGSNVAAGIVKIDSGELWFEGDLDGTGTVSVVRYYLDTSTTNNCPCLRRSQLPKQVGNPYTGQTSPSYQVEVQNVLNTDIFTAYKKGAAGTPVTLPVNFNANATTIANIDSIKAVITVRSSHRDTDTNDHPISTLVTSVKLNNCSHAASGQAVSCR